MSNYKKGAAIAIGVAITGFIIALFITGAEPSQSVSGEEPHIIVQIIALAIVGCVLIIPPIGFFRERASASIRNDLGHELDELTWQDAVSQAVETTTQQEASRWATTVDEWKDYASHLKAQLEMHAADSAIVIEQQQDNWYQAGIKDGRAESREALQAAMSETQVLEKALEEAQELANEVPSLQAEIEELINAKKQNWQAALALLEMLPKKVSIRGVRDAVRKAGFALPDSEYKAFSEAVRNRPSVSKKKMPAQKAEKEGDSRTDGRTDEPRTDGRVTDEA